MYKVPYIDFNLDQSKRGMILFFSYTIQLMFTVYPILLINFKMENEEKYRKLVVVHYPIDPALPY